MPKHDIGELIAALNEAVNKLNNLRTKYDDLQAENARLREALKKFSCNCVSNCEWERSDTCMSWIARAALGEKE